MKKLAAFMLVLSLSVFSIGCGAEKPPEPGIDGPAADADGEHADHADEDAAPAADADADAAPAADADAAPAADADAAPSDEASS